MSDEYEDLAITGFNGVNEDPEPPVVQVDYSEKQQSGHCPKCRKRYTQAPVVDGVVICPNCG
jgi:hypothetical protein